VIQRWVARVPRRIRFHTLLAWGLLLVVFGSLVYGLADAVRGIERGLLWPVVWVGLFLAWGLASSRLAGWKAAALSGLVSVVSTAVQVGQLGDPLASLVRALGGLAAQMVLGMVPPDGAPVQAAWAELAGDGQALLTRLATWMGALAGGAPPYDPVVTTVLWGLALWGVVLWAGWAVRRRAQPVLGLAPAVALLASSLFFVGGRAGYLLPALAATLVLKAWVGHGARWQAWQRSGFKQSTRIRADTAWLALGIAAGLTLAAAIIPSISMRRIVESVRQISSERVEGEGIGPAVGLEPQAASGEMHILLASQGGGLPRDHLVGAGPQLSEQVAMVVRIESAPAAAPEHRHYWRSLTYDRYTGRGWSTGATSIVEYAAGDMAASFVPATHRLVRQNVRLAKDSAGLVWVAGSLVTVDRDYQIAWRRPPEAETAGDLFGGAAGARSYRADSLVPVFGETDLRAAGQDYPAWVVDAYLELPDTVPDRVLALARDLTATEPTPYDRALAIERYLRQFPYTLELPAPPVDRDLVDYFLFALRRGYCDYYASAMVVLARAAGLPARLVTGYATGTYDDAQGQVVVTQDQAHSWVDVYFPGYGWVEFEPTAGRSELERQTDGMPQVPPDLRTLPEPITAYRTRRTWMVWLGAVGGLLILAVGGGFAGFALDGWRLQRLAPGTAVVLVYQRLVRASRRLGVAARSSHTPYEFAALVAERTRRLSQDRRVARLVRTLPGEVRGLAALCTRALYSLHRLHVSDQERAIRTWKRLRARVWLAGWIHRASRRKG
jgi:transglutaminase-like putative cysteine protease